ncbi:caspase-6-like [Euwallacea similis]|uniref:caspase-6-like n=1 Tax=Euwallacea similis TaxID=1736056 RepID=UPI003450FE18
MSLQQTSSDVTKWKTRTGVLPKPIINHASDIPLKERDHLSPVDKFEYDRQGSDPGRIIIFNQEFGDDSTLKREGSRRDVNEIILCFQRLGFNIFEEDVLVDKTEDEILGKLDSVIEDTESLKKINCLIIFFFTHGDTKNCLYVKGGTMNCSDIWVKFLNCPILQKKPKMVVFQACKGENFSLVDGKNVTSKNSSELLDMDSFSVTQLPNNMLILFSTTEGNMSYRHPVTGTWFIQELCRNFSMYGRRDDVISLITRTMKCVCGNYYLQLENEISAKQMPIFVSTLTKKFYLNRNKDRHLLLEINRKQDELLELVREILELSKQQKASKK